MFECSHVVSLVLDIEYYLVKGREKETGIVKESTCLAKWQTCGNLYSKAIKQL